MMMWRVAARAGLLLSLLLLLRAGTSEAADADSGADVLCPCLFSHPEAIEEKYDKVIDGKQCLAYIPPGSKEEYCYPPEYGLGKCNTWDVTQQPDCAEMKNGKLEPKISAPEWCEHKWCYVDPNKCRLDEEKDPPTSSFFFGQKNELFFSYETCGSETAVFAKHARAAMMSAKELVTVVEGYVREAQETVEKEYSRIVDSESASNCPHTDSCKCDSCKMVGGTWDVTKVAIDYKKVSVTHPGGVDKGTPAARDAQCLAKLVGKSYKKVVRQEYNDKNRIAYQYYGDQATGILFQWPAVQYCPKEGEYDPRFKAWYAGSVSGPKDVVLVVDTSGSMGKAGRMEAAKKAAAKVLETLNEYDYVGIVAFDAMTAIFEEDGAKLYKATAKNIEMMKTWIADLSPVGGTNFRDAFKTAFELIGESASAGQTTNCNGALLFMTDGVDESGVTPDEVTALNKPGYTIFTYSFGAEADPQVPRDIACANKGIWYQIDDGGNIADAMAKYFTYYAEALAESTVVRWSDYKDSISGERLVTGCMPIYDRSGSPAKLTGVTCMDVNMVIHLDTLRLKDDYPAAVERMDQDSKTCVKADFGNTDLQRLRRHVSKYAVCGSDLPKPGQSVKQDAGAAAPAPAPAATTDSTATDTSGSLSLSSSVFAAAVSSFFFLLKRNEVV